MRQGGQGGQDGQGACFLRQDLGREALFLTAFYDTTWRHLEAPREPKYLFRARRLKKKHLFRRYFLTVSDPYFTRAGLRGGANLLTAFYDYTLVDNQTT